MMNSKYKGKLNVRYMNSNDKDELKGQIFRRRRERDNEATTRKNQESKKSKETIGKKRKRANKTRSSFNKEKKKSK